MRSGALVPDRAASRAERDDGADGDEPREEPRTAQEKYSPEKSPKPTIAQGRCGMAADDVLTTAVETDVAATVVVDSLAGKRGERDSP